MTTITLELSPELEHKLRESIVRRDSRRMRQLLADAFAPTVEALLGEAPNQAHDDEFELLADRLADEFASCFDSSVPMLSDEALSRASIYGEHP